MRKLREKVNIYVAKTPQKAVLIGIMLFNVVFILIAAAIISIMSHSLSGMSASNFGVAIYKTITMILDAGCIDSIIADVGKAGAAAAIVCVIVIIVGMVFFTGAVIGYVTNGISAFIESKNNGKNHLVISDHVVIINWNTSASEIINGFLYAQKPVKVVVFVTDHKEEIEEEIRNRLDTTLNQTMERLLEASKDMSRFGKKKYIREHKLKDYITYIVREGDVGSASDLDDICISKAKDVIIMDNEKYGKKSAVTNANGNTQTVKTLIQVSEISKGNRNQTIIVEVADAWTESLVNKIIDFKIYEAQETIVPVLYNRLLGKSYSQIAANPKKTLEGESVPRSIIIMGHNNNMDCLMKEFDAIRNERNNALNIFVVDDEESLASHDYYKDYSGVTVINADIYDESIIDQNINHFFENALEETTIMILSDDSAEYDDLDSDAFTYLIYIQEEIRRIEATEPEFDRNKLDIIVEILNPRNEDMVKSYGADNVIIGNRYLSRVISQLCMEKDITLT